MIPRTCHNILAYLCIALLSQSCGYEDKSQHGNVPSSEVNNEGGKEKDRDHQRHSEELLKDLAKQFENDGERFSLEPQKTILERYAQKEFQQGSDSAKITRPEPLTAEQMSIAGGLDSDNKSTIIKTLRSIEAKDLKPEIQMKIANLLIVNQDPIRQEAAGALARFTGEHLNKILVPEFYEYLDTFLNCETREKKIFEALSILVHLRPESIKTKNHVLNLLESKDPVVRLHALHFLNPQYYEARSILNVLEKLLLTNSEDYILDNVLRKMFYLNLKPINIEVVERIAQLASEKKSKNKRSALLMISKLLAPTSNGAVDQRIEDDLRKHFGDKFEIFKKAAFHEQKQQHMLSFGKNSTFSGLDSHDKNAILSAIDALHFDDLTVSMQGTLLKLLYQGNREVCAHIASKFLEFSSHGLKLILIPDFNTGLHSFLSIPQESSYFALRILNHLNPENARQNNNFLRSEVEKALLSKDPIQKEKAVTIILASGKKIYDMKLLKEIIQLAANKENRTARLLLAQLFTPSQSFQEDALLRQNLKTLLKERYESMKSSFLRTFPTYLSEKPSPAQSKTETFKISDRYKERTN